MILTAGLLLSLAIGSDAGFVTTAGSKFQLNGGDFYFAGANSYAVLYSREHAERVFLAAKALGLNAVRFWGFWDGDYQDEPGKMRPGADRFGQVVMQSSPRVYQEEGLRKLDYALYRANVHGIKLIIPLVNEWGEFGGIVKYLNWAGIETPQAPGTCLDNPAEVNTRPLTDWTNCFEGEVKISRGLFWSCEECHEIYRDWVEMLLNRVNTYTGVVYKDDPAVMIWEVMNEPRFGPWLTDYEPGVEIGGQQVTAFLSESAAFIKSIDSNHLVSHGGEGLIADELQEDFERISALIDRPATGRGPWSYPWYQGYGEGVDFERESRIESVDALSIHAWPFNWSVDGEYGDSEAIAQFMPEWIVAHVRLLEEWGIEKPLYLGEFGWQILRVPDSGSDVPDRDLIYEGTLNTALQMDLPGLAYWDMVPRNDVEFATYKGPIERTRLRGGVFDTDDVHPHDLDFNFDVYCPEDVTTCALISAYAEQVNAKVENPDPPWVDPCSEDAPSLCGGECVDLKSDLEHCGRCTNACGDGESCFRGWCIVPPEDVADETGDGELAGTDGELAADESSASSGCRVDVSRNPAGWLALLALLGLTNRRRNRSGRKGE